jgi:hypothetical protein
MTDCDVGDDRRGLVTMADSDLEMLVAAKSETLEAWLDTSEPEAKAKIARHPAALSNNGGGYLIFGVSLAWTTKRGSRNVRQTSRDDLAPRLASRVQLTSDGHKPYLEAIEGAFGGDIDYAMLVKVYGPAPEGQRRYSPAICTGAHKHRVEGNPDPKHVSTSYAERQNLNIRMGNRRMTRLTNAFSKKAENHAHMMAIYFMHYNFVRIHQTLKVTPAMAAGVTPKLWEMADMVKVLEAWEAAQ